MTTTKNKDELHKIIKEEEIFSYLDFEKRSDKTKFGLLLKKFENRILSDIKLEIEPNTRSSRAKVRFVKSGKVGNLGNLPHSSASRKKQEVYRIGSSANVTNVTNVTKPKEKNISITYEDVKDNKLSKTDMILTKMIELDPKNKGLDIDLFKEEEEVLEWVNK